MSTLKEKIKEIADIAASVPENLQASCFEILLRDYLQSISEQPASRQQRPDEPKPPAVTPVDEAKPVEEAAKGQSDVTMADIHLKARKFMEKYSVTITEINNLFYKDAGVITPLYEDVKTTRMSEAQIRITLLQGLRSALIEGEFAANVEDVRTECRDRKTLDGANFSANYKNNNTLFDFEKFDREIKSVRLSENGRKELAQLIKELQ
ncbi:MAG: hypothetical protein M3O31_06445 [Acidobacteriota bacterium]|nr:hypothetical protein [Acidobacteriota bacterium]